MFVGGTTPNHTRAMPFLASLAGTLTLPDNRQGQALAILSIVSLAGSSISLGLSGVRLGSTSWFLIPSAWFITVIHHFTVWRLLVKFNHKAPTSFGTPQCLKHAGNISVLFLLSLCWISAGSVAVAFTVLGSPFGSRTMSNIPDWISSGLAFVEAVILLFMMLICWRSLAREGYGPTCTL
jgi:hypothetical protein